METRSIAIGLVAVVAAFAAAFGMARSGGSKTDTAGAGVKAQSIKVASPAAVTGVEVGGTLPALRTERKKAAKKKTPTTTATTNTTSPSSTNDTSTAQANTNTQPTNNTQSTTTQQTQTQTQTNTQSSKPKPAEQPAQGGGEDG
jgi:FtsZ-interacting cell division protein ZipA